MSPEEEIIGLMCAYLDGLPGAEDFHQALTRVSGTPEGVESTGGLDPVTANDWTATVTERGRPLVDAMNRHMEHFAWWYPYGGDPRAGRGFATGATANAVVGPWAPLKADHVGAGFFALNQGIEYADHAHAPDEIYVPLAGHANFHCEHYGDLKAGPDKVIYQPSWKWHSMETPDSPVLLLWVWIGEGLHELPVFRGEDGVPVAVDL